MFELVSHIKMNTAFNIRENGTTKLLHVFKTKNKFR